MKQFLNNYFPFLFLIIVAIVLYANATEHYLLDLIFKPLIVISLLVYLFIMNGIKRKAVVFAISGLILSSSGDVLLLFQKQNALFFMGGLISFLLAHVAYIFYYVRSSDVIAAKKLNAKLIFVLMLVLFGTVFYSILYNGLGGLKIPVFVYTVVLIGMNVSALNRYGKVNSKSFDLIMLGAICFLLSDSLLAFNKFYMPLPFGGILIMGTYAAAQYFIVKGVIANGDAV